MTHHAASHNRLYSHYRLAPSPRCSRSHHSLAPRCFPPSPLSVCSYRTRCIIISLISAHSVDPAEPTAASLCLPLPSPVSRSSVALGTVAVPSPRLSEVHSRDESFAHAFRPFGAEMAENGTKNEEREDEERGEQAVHWAGQPHSGASGTDPYSSPSSTNDTRASPPHDVDVNFDQSANSSPTPPTLAVASLLISSSRTITMQALSPILAPGGVLNIRSNQD